MCSVCRDIMECGGGLGFGEFKLFHFVSYEDLATVGLLGSAFLVVIKPSGSSSTAHYPSLPHPGSGCSCS